MRQALGALFDAAVASADPRLMLAAHLPEKPAGSGRCIVVGAGKASARMAAALEDAWPDVKLTGLVVAPYGHRVDTRSIEVLEAAHPIPDAQSEHAARRILDAVAGLQAHDLVIALISGGGSSLLALPAPGLTLNDKQAVNRELLLAGASIREMNAVRKHLSAIKGGRLARAASPARVVTLAISDVAGDDPHVIASGPTVPDESTLADVRAIVARYRLPLPPAVAAYLERAEETPQPRDLAFDVRVIATPAHAMRAAAARAHDFGLRPLILGELEGESRDLGIVMAGIALSVRRHGEPIAPPAVLISGGETVVTLGRHAHGRGGRAMEFALSLALALDAAPNMYALAGDTDGRDGNADAAGAFVAPDSLQRARMLGLDPRALLEAHDSFAFFEPLGDLLITGPTLTNVNALRAVIVW